MMDFVNYMDCFKDITGGNLKIKQQDYLNTGKYPIVDQGKELIGGYSDLPNIVRRFGNVIVFGDHTGTIKYIDFDFILGADGVKVIEPDYNLVIPKFGYYALQKVHVPDTGYDRKYKYLKRARIPLPPLPTQKKIAAILDEADHIRQLNNQLIQKYDALTQSLFLDMFGDPIRNPKGWEKLRMENLMKIVRGGSPRPIEKYLGGSYPWIKIGDGTKGGDIYLEETKEHIIKEGLNKTRLLPAGSLIFANCGVSLGFARIITFEGCIHDGWLAFSKINENVLNNIFLLKTLNSITNYFRKTAPDGTQPNLNTSIMKSFKLIVPPIKLQNQFAERIQAIEVQKDQAEAALQKSEDLFNSLLQRAFKGELI